MDPARKALLDHVADQSNSPSRVLGAAIAYVRHSGDYGKYIADAADAAILKAIEELKEHSAMSKASQSSK